MIIKKSDIQMQADSVSKLESTLSSTKVHTFLNEFTNQKLKSDEKEEYIRNLLPISKTSEVSLHEENLPIKDLVQKMLLEIILQAFSIDKKKISLFPYGQNNCACKKEKEIDYKMPDINKIKSSFKFESVIEYYKKSTVSFSSSIEIQTENKNIKVDLDVSFTQEFYEKHSSVLSYDEMLVFDPLVLSYNFDETSYDSLSKMHFEFDLNSDGELNSIPLLNKGYGFLAHDSNNNGIIDNGSELFGPRSNNGFEELRAFDKDKNNFIDEQDDIYKNLKVWSINDNGDNTLISLSDTDIGAIYLNDISSSFTYSHSIQQEVAQLNSTSIFLNKEGTKAGLITSLDFLSKKV